ncbi:hypothetical protein K435DRAFT_880146 [Dendrothele bispora CBS 962.96]|uniref:Uncharacterized protein n=1 Tax=Dendrothele bispora (strain CBS 962.96) TaxID=1314807 RepID=A0A4S8KK03_DENBC|nr:hypothetical protein K435DRAFT_880146 [Dendrothele bispora CBS 962.96]
MSDHSSQRYPTTPSHRHIPNLDLIPASSQNLPELNQWYPYGTEAGFSTAMDSGTAFNTRSVYRFPFPQENLYGYRTPGPIPTECLPPHKSPDEMLQFQSLFSNPNAVEETASVIQGQGHDEGFPAVMSNFGQPLYGPNGLRLIRKAGGHGRQPPFWHFPKQITLLPETSTRPVLAEEPTGDMTRVNYDESNLQVAILSEHAEPTCVATEATLKASRRRRKNQTGKGPKSVNQCHPA